MKKILFAGLVFIYLIVNVQQTSAQKEEKYLTAIAFYNLENLFDIYDDPKKYDEDFTPTGAYKYTEEVYQKKLDNMAKVLSEIATDKLPEGPAIIGVAEVENITPLRDLLAMPKLKQRGWKAILIEGPDARGIDVGLIYNPKFFKVIEAKSHFVNIENNESKSKTRDILQVTGVLLGDTLTVLVGHWPSRRGGEAASQWKRARAAQVCKDIKDSLVAANPNARVVIMGDLNDDPVSPSVAKTLGAKGDKDAVEKGGLFNPFYDYFKKGIGTLGYNDGWNLFDQIIISSGFIQGADDGWQFKEAKIFDKNYLRNQFGKYKGYPHRSFEGSVWIDGYSDHLPTYIYITKTKK